MTMIRSLLIGLVCLLLVAPVAVPVAGSATAARPGGPASGSRPEGQAPPCPPAPADAWRLGTGSAAAAAAAPAYVGNGYVGTRVPSRGHGFVSAPVAAETHVAGVWADVPDTDHGGTFEQGGVNLPGWTRLDLRVGGESWFGGGQVRCYHQQLDLRRGMVTTTGSWRSGDGRVTDVRYQVVLDRRRARVGLVRLTVTPHWSGRIGVTDRLGEGLGYTDGLAPVHAEAAAADGAAELVVRTDGTDQRVAYADRLLVPDRASVTGTAGSGRTTLRAGFRVRAGRTYTVAKVVGFATSADSDAPRKTAERAARTAARTGAAGVVAESAKAWRDLWRSDIRVAGQPDLQRRIRAAMFYLLASSRQGVDWSISPVGLSSYGYNDHVFWDAETWMYPSLLAQHPGVASTVVDYRYRTRDGARRNARETGYSGLRYAWESALTGDEVTPTWAETRELEQHVTADVALGQWQYYLATGDRRWLRERGWPVLRGAAQFWAGRAEPNGDGTYSITDIEGPDEHNWPVDDSVYTNVGAATTLRIASRAARLIGAEAPARWRAVADGLRVLAPRAIDGFPAVRPEYVGYDGETVKQADAVLLTYPWEHRQPDEVDRSTLEYYVPRYDVDGPAMTDSVNAVVASQLGVPGCSSWTYTQRSLLPFVRGPYEQFTEARGGQGVFTFHTGEGGFLQAFLYGYTGLRWRPDRVWLDPSLTRQLAGGLTVTDLHWHGRTFTVRVGPRTTHVRLESGAPMPIASPSGTQTVSTSTPVTLPTRRPDQRPTSNVARCRPASATAADISYLPGAAVDGRAVTGWSLPEDNAERQTLTVDLERERTIRAAEFDWLRVPHTGYRLQVRRGGDWLTVLRVGDQAGSQVRREVDPVQTTQVRLVLPRSRIGGLPPILGELAVLR